MTPPLTIALFYGGASPEHGVSLVSAKNLLSYPNRERYTIAPIGVTKENRWYLQDLKTLTEDTTQTALSIEVAPEKEVFIQPGCGLMVGGKNLSIDVAVIMIHGTHGEDGVLQGALEIADIPYTGANLLASALSMNKIAAKQIWEQKGLPVTPYTTLSEEEWQAKGVESARLQAMVEHLPEPIFIKPAEGGSSLGISRATNRKELIEGIEFGFAYDRELLIEVGLRVREIEFAILGERVFHPGEINSHGFYDYATKYESEDTDMLHTHAELSENLLQEMKQIALEAYKALRIRSFARVDLFLTDSKKIYINEINTIPGMTGISMFPSTIMAEGLSPEELFEQWIELALKKDKEKERRKTTVNRV